MKTAVAMRALAAANPRPLPPPARSRRRGVRVGAIAMCTAALMSLAAVGYTHVAGQRFVIAAWNTTAITEPSSHDDAMIDVNDPAIVMMINQLKHQYPLPASVGAAEAYAPLEGAFPIPEGGDWPAVDGPFQPFHYLSFVPSDGPNSPPKYVDAREIAGTVGVLSANAWYQYWLTGDTTQRREAAGVISQIPTWSDVVWRVEDGGNPDRIGIVENLTRAVATGDETAVRTWFTKRQWSPPEGG